MGAADGTGAPMFRYKVLMSVVEGVPIEELALTGREYNALVRAKILTIGELVERYESLHKAKNLGRKSLSHIKAELFAWYLKRVEGMRVWSSTIESFGKRGA